MKDLLQATPVALRQLLVCQFLSRSGQLAMLAVDQGFLVNVPLALAQLISSGHANQV